MATALEGLPYVLFVMVLAPIAFLVVLALMGGVLAALAGVTAAVQALVAVMAAPLPARWRAWLVERRITAALD